MKIGILADVHSNLEALEAVLKEIKKESPDIIIFLGDAVGYGANPNECCEILKDIGTYSLIGNHDAACTGKIYMNWFSNHAKDALEWTIPRLTKPNMDWLKQCYWRVGQKDFAFCHGSPLEPEKFNYILDNQDAEKAFLWMEEMGISIVFIGHSHIAVTFEASSQEISMNRDPEIIFQQGKQYVVSVGSVGQPRDNDCRACYGILDTDMKVYISKRVDYDIRTASDKILRAIQEKGKGMGSGAS
jgi:putative phosphoesterase